MSQHMDALARANSVRLAIAEVRREVRAGDLTIEAALNDPRAQPMTVARLLSAQRRWADVRTHRFLGTCQIRADKKVRELTDRQKEQIVLTLLVRKPGSFDVR